MKKNIKSFILTTAIFSLVLTAGCSTAQDNELGSSTDVVALTQATSSTKPTPTPTPTATPTASANVKNTQAASAKTSSEDFYLDWKSHSYTSIELSNGSYTVTKSGTYVLSGTLTDGSITVDIDKSVDKGTVFLVMNNANISSASGTPINVIDAKKVVLFLENGTTNTVTQGNVISNSEDFPSAAIFSKANLTITGSGTLNVTTEYNDGITSKDSLIIMDGTINVKTAGDAIIGKDLLQIDGGDFTISTGGGYPNQSIKLNRFSNGSGGRGQTSTISTNDVSTKGLKSEGEIIINGGTFIMSIYQDAIHASGEIRINDGTFTINAGDDGIHSDTSIVIENGNIDIQNSYEGIESNNTIINNGTIKIVSSDDGINISERTGMLTINGGDIYIESGGDSLDSNGNIVQTGGKITINTAKIGQADESVDYDGTFTSTGGTIVDQNGNTIDPFNRKMPGGMKPPEGFAPPQGRPSR